MAYTMLSIITNQPLPDSGIGHQRLTLLFDGLLALLTIALLLSLVRVRRRHRRMVQQGIASRSEFWSRVAIALLVNFALPMVLLYLTFFVPAWNALTLFHPDLGFWLAVVAVVFVLKGVVELLLIASAYRQSEDAKFLARTSEIRMRVVVVGGGIGGLAAARHLDRRLGRRQDVDITLVNRDNFFLLSPLLFEACSGVLELRHCAQPIRPCLRRVRFIEAMAEEIDVDRRIVRVTGPDDALRDLPFDHVVVAPGAATKPTLLPG